MFRSSDWVLDKQVFLKEPRYIQQKLSRKKRWLAGWLITAALIAALMVTTTAFAEGEQPADPPESEPAAAETEAPPAEEAVPPPEEETSAEEAAPPPEEGAPAEEPAAEPEADEPPAEAEIVEAAADAGAELVDASGEPIDLASRESGDLISSADPYFSVGSITYRFYEDPGICGVDPYCFDNQGSDVIQGCPLALSSR